MKQTTPNKEIYEELGIDPENLTPWKTPSAWEFNPWHSVDIGGIAQLFCYIEIPRGSKYKYELHKDTGILMLDRVLHSAVHYPANYGFIPRTYCDDQDPLDVLVFGQEPVFPGVLLRAKPIGVMTMVDNMEKDDKIVAVHADDPEYSHYEDLHDLPPHKTREMQRFFMDYKALEKGDRKVFVEKFSGRREAEEIIYRSLDLYKEKILNPVKASK